MIYDALALAFEIAEPLQYRMQLTWRRCLERREVLRAKRAELQLFASRRRRKPNARNSGNHGFDCSRGANSEHHAGILDVVRQCDQVRVRNIARLKPVENLPALGAATWMQPHPEAQPARAMKCLVHELRRTGLEVGAGEIECLQAVGTSDSLLLILGNVLPSVEANGKAHYDGRDVRL